MRRVRPSQEDRARMRMVVEGLASRIEQAAAGLGIPVRPILVGSAARGTWLAGDHDLDIFLGVPEGCSLEDALRVARLVAPEHEEKYAEHPYLHASIEGFDLDLVPCYLVKDASLLRSAVDRTPFHNAYVASRIQGLEDEVLLLKQFMKGIGVYGSELRTGGFSGYLAELLVLFYGSFLDVLRAASLWRPGERIDLEGNRLQPERAEPLTVVDPVDPSRNVAAALTEERMLEFALSARCFLRMPAMDFFFPESPRPLEDGELAAIMSERRSKLILIEFPAPPVVEDVLFPQLRKAEGSVRALLEREGFSVLRSDVGCFQDGRGCLRAVILLEMEVWELSRACRREGPPVWEAEHLDRFLAAHPQPLSGPYISGGRVVVEIPRRYTHAWDLLDAEIGGLSLGRHLAPAIRREHNIYVGSRIATIKEDGFRLFLSCYFRARAAIWTTESTSSRHGGPS
ncbi:MAG: CCA tRNA nucleotidyltransferase [Methanothrix sp.]|nr:CCA tRNA nucleotidyltransferase [Methanothrix sp.]